MTDTASQPHATSTSSLTSTHTDVAQLVTAVADTLMQHGWMLTTAESCTGGLIAGHCTDLAGSSQWFERGFVTYSNEAKHDMLGVDNAILTEHGIYTNERRIELLMADWVADTIEKGHTRGVIASVLHPPQSVHNHVAGGSMAYIRHDSAHGLPA